MNVIYATGVCFPNKSTYWPQRHCAKTYSVSSCRIAKQSSWNCTDLMATRVGRVKKYILNVRLLTIFVWVYFCITSHKSIPNKFHLKR